jgi:hypothetical protein
MELDQVASEPDQVAIELDQVSPGNWLRFAMELDQVKVDMDTSQFGLSLNSVLYECGGDRV